MYGKTKAQSLMRDAPWNINFLKSTPSDFIQTLGRNLFIMDRYFIYTLFVRNTLTQQHHETIDLLDFGQETDYN